MGSVWLAGSGERCVGDGNHRCCTSAAYLRKTTNSAK
jgi:hypothetical protein